MGILVTICSIILLCCILVLSIPFTYQLTFQSKQPCHVDGIVQWGIRLMTYQLAYTYGEKAVITQTWLHHKKQSKLLATPETEPTDAEIEAAAKAIEAEENLTYHDIHHDQSTPPQETRKQSLKSLIFNTSFLGVFFTYVQRLLCHSRIRSLQLSGSLGLPQPHETGMVAGALYAVMPRGIENLHFNFLAEEYDCTLTVKGHMYPIVLLAYTVCFAISRPARQVIAYWRAQKRGEPHHG